MALSMAVVITAVVVGYVVGAFVIALVPGAPLKGGVSKRPQPMWAFFCVRSDRGRR